MTAMTVLGAGASSTAGRRPTTDSAETSDLAFAAILEAAQLGAIAQSLDQGPSRSSERPEDRPLLRFSETSILGRLEPIADGASSPTPFVALARNEPGAANAAREPAPVSSEFSAPERGAALGALKQAQSPLTRASVPARQKTWSSGAPPAASTQSDPIQSEQAASSRAPAPLRRPAPGQHANAIHVAVHAIEADPLVYARPGRMAPTERERLRNAIGALLREYGVSNATIKLDGGNLGASHG